MSTLVKVTEDEIVIRDFYGREDRFKIRHEVRWGYVVWNIGRRNFPIPGYLPMAAPGYEPYHINRNDLVAYKMDEKLADFILKEATRGTLFRKLLGKYEVLNAIHLDILEEMYRNGELEQYM